MDEVWKGKHFIVCQEDVEVAPGKIIKFEYVWRIDGTRSIVENDEGEILLTKEYRHEQNGFDWRLPGGKLDFVGEDIPTAAARELKEETGVSAKNWKFLWTSTPDSMVRFQRHFLYAKDIKIGKQQLEVGEKIEPHWFAKPEIIEMAFNGDIKEEISALSLLRIFKNRICVK